MFLSPLPGKIVPNMQTFIWFAAICDMQNSVSDTDAMSCSLDVQRSVVVFQFQCPLNVYFRRTKRCTELPHLRLEGWMLTLHDESPGQTYSRKRPTVQGYSQIEILCVANFQSPDSGHRAVCRTVLSILPRAITLRPKVLIKHSFS